MNFVESINELNRPNFKVKEFAISNCNYIKDTFSLLPSKVTSSIYSSVYINYTKDSRQLDLDFHSVEDNVSCVVTENERIIFYKTLIRENLEQAIHAFLN